MKYIDAEKLLDILIKKQKEYATQEVAEDHKGLRAVLGGQLLVLTKIIEIIDSLQQDKDVLDLCSQVWWEDRGWIMIPPNVTLKGIESLLERVRHKIKWNEENGIEEQEQPIEGKQVVIITETDGEANIHWDCRSLDDIKALLASAQSFIADKQVEELRGQGSGPDYNTTEGRFRNAHKFQQEQPEVDLDNHTIMEEIRKCGCNPNEFDVARHFYKFGLNARKEG